VRVWSAVDEQVYITEYGFHALLSQFKAAANRGLLAGVYKCVLARPSLFDSSVDR
jgi:hypothetical protein